MLPSLTKHLQIIVDLLYLCIMNDTIGPLRKVKLALAFTAGLAVGTLVMDCDNKPAVTPQKTSFKQPGNNDQKMTFRTTPDGRLYRVPHNDEMQFLPLPDNSVDENAIN